MYSRIISRKIRSEVRLHHKNHTHESIVLITYPFHVWLHNKLFGTNIRLPPRPIPFCVRQLSRPSGVSDNLPAHQINLGFTFADPSRFFVTCTTHFVVDGMRSLPNPEWKGRTGVSLSGRQRSADGYCNKMPLGREKTASAAPWAEAVSHGVRLMRPTRIRNL